jgi:hypothetical protein
MTTPTSAGWYPDPDGSRGQRYWDGTSWTDEQPTAVVHLRSVPTEPHATPPSSDNRSLVIRFGAACAALLVILLGLAVYGFLIKKAPEVQLSTPGDGDSWGEPSEMQAAAPTATPPPSAPSGQATDGPMAFTVSSMEIGPTVGMSDTPLEKTAEGQFVVLHMTVSNTGPDAESFVGTFQTLLAGGATYRLADEATAYLGGTAAELPPGTSTDVSIAFDVPPGTMPEAIELHSEPGSPGVRVPLP